MKILHLNVKKKYFVQIASGEKKIEYRVANKYWSARLIKSYGLVIIMNQFDEIWIKNGYARKGKPAPLIKMRHWETDLELVEYPESGKIEICFCIYLGDTIK